MSLFLGVGVVLVGQRGELVAHALERHHHAGAPGLGHVQENHFEIVIEQHPGI
jgi:hypothetical protein